MDSSQTVQEDPALWTGPGDVEVFASMVFAAIGSWAPMIIALSITVAVVRAYGVSRRAGTGLMLAGAVLFWLGLAAYFFAYPRLILAPRTLLSSSAMLAAPMVPLLLFAAGFLRLAWSLKRPVESGRER